MNKGRRAKIEAWVKYLEVFLPWIAPFYDRTVGSAGLFCEKQANSEQRLGGGKAFGVPECSLTFGSSLRTFPVDLTF